MTPEQFANSVNRRTFLQQSGYGLGAASLGMLLGQNLARSLQAGETTSIPSLLEPIAKPSHWRGELQQPDYPVRAKRIIHLYMAGGPSHCDTFDYKPELEKLNGKPFPESFTQGQQLAQLQSAKLIARGPAFKFAKQGQSGHMISSVFPEISKVADEISVIKSLYTEQINHDTAHAFMNSGSIIKGRPSMGSWLLYGLGAETDNLPGFIVLATMGRTGAQPISARQWSSGFLASKFQGIQFQTKGDPVHYLGNPDGVCQSTQRQVIDEIQRLNGMRTGETLDPEIETRIAQYELAFKMQTSVPDLIDNKKESQATLDMYGIKDANERTFASNCLLARRMVEKGVRVVQVYHRGWDHHGSMERELPLAATETDKATAGLIMDLKQRDMLKDTLIIWGGEFGRTPMGQGNGGRDHHILGFSAFMAGGGIKPGVSFGETDELGYKATVDRTHVRDLHATILALMGIDHRKLSVKFQGLDARLTGVEPANLIRKIMA